MVSLSLAIVVALCISSLSQAYSGSNTRSRSGFSHRVHTGSHHSTTATKHAAPSGVAVTKQQHSLLAFTSPVMFKNAASINVVKAPSATSCTSLSSPKLRSVCRMSGGAAAQETAEGGKCGMTASVFNLVKNIMGAGMLSLPAGVAAFSDRKASIVPATTIIAVAGALSAYTFSLIGRSCSQSKAESYEQAWARTVDAKSSWLPAGACVATCFAGCLAYTIIIGDTFSALLRSAGAAAAISSRTNIIAALSTTVLLPLVLMKNLSALGFTSMLGTGGLVYTAVMMAIRFFDGTYAPGGKFFGALPVGSLPVFGSRTPRPVLLLVLVSMLGTAYEAHFNAPLFYRELKNNTVARYNTMVILSFVAAIVTMSAVSAFGFLTFGGAASGFILNNYAATDGLAAIARVFVGVSIVFSYPLCFVGLRDGILEMRGITKPSDKTRTAWSIGLVGITSLLATFLTDLGFVNSFFGALIASGIIYVFPAMMFLTPLRRKFRSGVKTTFNRLTKLEMSGNYGVVVVGVVMGLLGAIVSVLETFFPHLLT